MITTAQQQIYQFKLRVETSSLQHSIGDGDSLSCVRWGRILGWFGDDDNAARIEDNDFTASFWRLFGSKAVARRDLPGTLQRYILVGVDTQEVCQNAACHQHYAAQGRQWLGALIRRLRGQTNQEPRLILDVFGVEQYGPFPWWTFAGQQKETSLIICPGER